MSCFKQADSPLLFSSSSLNPVAGSRKPVAKSCLIQTKFIDQELIVRQKLFYQQLLLIRIVSE
jgi:hypothetical protein